MYTKIVSPRTRQSGLLWKLLLVGICGVFIFTTIHLILKSPKFNQYNILKAHRSKVFTTEPKTILLWDGALSDEVLSDFLNSTYFKELGCPETNCIITRDSRYLQSLDMFKAIVYHEPLGRVVPNVRDPEQFYVFSAWEPAAVDEQMIKKSSRNFYNLTMTYRLDSDIVWSYGRVLDKETGRIVAPNQYLTWRQPSEESGHETENLGNETKKIGLWRGSECPSDKVDKFLTKLEKFIELDRLSPCGDEICSSVDFEECEKLIEKNYAFQFIIEDFSCTDYISNDLYQALKLNIIPVIFGSADYNIFAPPKSYIRADDFQTLEDLIDHLEILSNSTEAYRKYFWWKDYYEIGQAKSPFCGLCSILNHPSERERQQIYSNIQEWWRDEDTKKCSKFF